LPAQLGAQFFRQLFFVVFDSDFEKQVGSHFRLLFSYPYTEDVSTAAKATGSEAGKAIGIAVFGHGSSVESANESVRAVARQAAREGGWALYETTFLEADPRLEEAVANLVRGGATEILVLPYFLTLGIHLQRDLPRLAADLAGKFGIPIQIAPPLDGHPALSRVLADRVKALLPGKALLP